MLSRRRRQLAEDTGLDAIYADDARSRVPAGRREDPRQAEHPGASIGESGIARFRAAPHDRPRQPMLNEYTIRYDGKPSLVVGIMEFAGGLVVRETVYVMDPWQPPAWRAQWVEPIDDPSATRSDT
jgi:hypothetical protein